MYLFLCVTVFDTHWDSGYASLQIEHYGQTTLWVEGI